MTACTVIKWKCGPVLIGLRPSNAILSKRSLTRRTILAEIFLSAGKHTPVICYFYTSRPWQSWEHGGTVATVCENRAHSNDGDGERNEPHKSTLNLFHLPPIFVRHFHCCYGQRSQSKLSNDHRLVHLIKILNKIRWTKNEIMATLPPQPCDLWPITW